MHEWSLALSIVQTLDRWARERDVQIKRVVVSVPSVSQLDLSIMREAFDMLKQDSRLSNAVLDLKVRSPKYRCRSCGYEFGQEEVDEQIKRLAGEYGEEYPLHLMPELLPTFVRCPRCGSHDIEAELSVKIDEVETI
ncbi:hydrogenase maturation nickel metallochaperone HypA [Thermoproteus tenax]|uniref:Hydrogenase maturation factor HypA n=1 Tax=Thermoproteus tenax (strain ATCC 35583 / DSM 2078 / JCM 9277 / NBRC 100435 / Kra 1) TaxID=768679 RepID=G4RMT4_THETK|nr:hydrogenase maturation nickel metallochaperone HypA [Thermoproteus tenax]CCC80878.1 hydrogenase nickel incorporation protein [Thermoproteus tenax Kra 1]